MAKIMVVSFQSLTENSGLGMARLGHSLSYELHKRGLLDVFVVHSKGKFETPFPSVPVSTFSRYYLYVLNKISKTYRSRSHKARFFQEQLFDWFCARRLDKTTDILFATQPYLKRTFRRAKQLNIKTILLSGTPEDDYIYSIVSEENKRLGITDTDAYTYEKRNKYFKESMRYLDIAIGFFPTVSKTYEQSLAFRGKVTDMPGHMTPDFPEFTISDKKKTMGKFIVGFLSYTVVLKGLQYLLEAWSCIMQEYSGQEIELIVGGPLNPIMEALVQRHFSNLDGVTYIGQVNDIPAFMQRLDLFVVPSLVDGGPMTALEAAHYAVPVLITENSGSSELICRGNGGGYIVPIRDARAIKEKILWAYNNREQNAQRGSNAKKNLTDYSFDDYINKLSDYLEKEVNG